MKYISKCSLSETIFQLRKKELAPEKLIDDLCDKLDKWDSIIKAFLPERDRQKRLHKELKQLYQKFPEQKTRPILFGIPVGVKDIFYVHGFLTKAGSKLPEKLFSDNEASCVTKLRNAGALILGKTHTTEFAYLEPGPTRNPRNLDHTPGGSSSGSAAAVSAGFCLLALGTQTIGSITRPASYCGINGFKPSYGRISTDGIVPFSQSADHIGFFTQDIEGIGLIASILCQDWNSNYKFSEKLPVLAVPEGNYLCQSSQESLNVFETQLAKLQKAGYVIKYIKTFDNIDKINFQHRLMISAEMAQVHKNWFKKYKKLYGKATKEFIQQGQKVTKQNLNKAREGQVILMKELEELKNKFKFNLWITPSTITDAPKGINSTGDPVMNLPWTYAGLPTITIPAGTSQNVLPLGLQIIASFGEDEKLIYDVKGINKHLNS